MDGQGTLSTSWTTLKPLLNNILVGRRRYEHFEWGYFQVYRAVFFGQGLQLYKLLEAEITKHLISQLQKRLSDLEGLPLLAELTKMWKSHKEARSLIAKVFLYCDNKFVARNELPSIGEMCNHLFRDKVVLEPAVEKKLRAALIFVVKQSRKGMSSFQDCLQLVCQMLIELHPGRNVYENIFETEFLNKTREYYTLEAKLLLKSNTCTGYVVKVENLIEKELLMCYESLDASTKTRLLDALNEVLICNQMQHFIYMGGSGVPTMIKVGDVNGLGKVFNTLSKVAEGPQAMATCLSAFLQERGSKIVQEPEGPLTSHGAFAINYVQRLIELKGLVDRFMELSFGENVFLKRAANADFEHFINANQRSPEYLSLFIDDRLRKLDQVVEIQQAEEDMAKALILFRFLREKDMFERYYKQHLAKRLLQEKALNEDWEQNMVNKLKAECGFQFTQNLEGMFKDMAYNVTLMEAFKSATASKQNKGDMDVDVKVLSPNNWPVNFPPPACTLPPFAADAFAAYEEFYLQRHQHRKLLVNSLLGGAEIAAHFYGVVPGDVDLRGPRKYYLSVTTQQMVLVDAFNYSDSYTFSELLEKTGLSEHDLTKNLTPMVAGKPNQQILLKVPADKDMLATDIFKINEFYHSKSQRVRLHPVASRVESVSERHKTRSLVEVDRKGELEAAVVRIMKEAKTLHQNALIARVIEQVKHRFTPTPGDIKKSIEGLCSREFLDCTDEDRKMIEYKP